MATKIRLQRHGRKGYAYYHIVIADERAPRDGRIIERVGAYNPNTNPATVDLNFDKALVWIMKGAQPTDTVRNILSEQGVMLMKHLLGGVKKGAFTQEVADKKFAEWKEKKAKDAAKLADKLAADKKSKAAARLKAEEAVNAAKAKVVAEKKAAAMEALEAAAKEAAAEAAEAEAEAKGEAPVEEAAPAAEAPAAE